MNRVKYALLAASFLLAMAFTVSCSSDDGNKGGIGAGCAMYDEDFLASCDINPNLTQASCEAKNNSIPSSDRDFLSYRWETNCPDGYKSKCGEYLYSYDSEDGHCY
jgi:hypothetical protein